MRKLASIRRVNGIRPIKDADFIELAIVDGWQVVCKKDELKENDLCVYFEIDSFLPEEERYEFLRKSCYKKILDKGGFRLRTAKFRGEISQGLALSLSKFPEIKNPKEGQEVTNLLNVEKYDPPIAPELAGVAKGPFPSFIEKTDEERIQNLLHYFEEYKDLEFEASVKLDGTSNTFYWKDGDLGVCSRNLELVKDFSNDRWKIAQELNLEERMRYFGRNLAFQGELFGYGIQKNNERIKDKKFRLFNIYDINEHRYVSFYERQQILDEFNKGFDQDLWIEQVPIICVEKVFQKYKTLEELLAFAEGPSWNTARKREGLVFKSEPIDKRGNIVSFKVISNSYLLKQKD